MFDWYVSFKSS